MSDALKIRNIRLIKMRKKIQNLRMKLNKEIETSKRTKTQMKMKVKTPIIPQ